MEADLYNMLAFEEIVGGSKLPAILQICNVYSTKNK